MKKENVALGEPLTLEQLREMDGKLVGIGDANGNVSENAIVNAVARFSLGRSGVLYLFEYYGKTWFAYAYPRAHIDREAWVPCDYCANVKYITGNATAVVPNKDNRQIETYMEGDFDYCPVCGRPLTNEAWAELEKRLRG